MPLVKLLRFLTFLFVLVTAAAFCQNTPVPANVHVGEKRSEIEAVLGKPSKESGAGLGLHHGLCNTCVYTKDGWNYAIDYLLAGELCTGIAYLKVDQSPISIPEMQQLLVWNSENLNWFKQPATDPKLVTYLRADKVLTAWLIGGGVLKIDVTAMIEADHH